MYEYINKYVLKNKFLVAATVIYFFYLLIKVIDIVFVLFAAYVIMTALGPFVKWLRNKKVPNALAILLPYLFTVLIFAILIPPAIPLIKDQFVIAVDRFTPLYNDLVQRYNISGASINSGPAVNAILSVTNGIVETLVYMLFSLFLSVYLFFNKKEFYEFIIKQFPKNYRKKVSATIDNVEFKLGAWFRGQLILSLTVGVITYIALLILGINLALPLAILAALLEILPNLGAIISAVPAILIGLEISPVKALTIFFVYLVIHQLEGQVLLPNVMKYAVELNPIVTILVILLGVDLFGAFGAVFAVPFTVMVVAVFSREGQSGDIL